MNNKCNCVAIGSDACDVLGTNFIMYFTAFEYCMLLEVIWIRVPHKPGQ